MQVEKPSPDNIAEAETELSPRRRLEKKAGSGGGLRVFLIGLIIGLLLVAVGLVVALVIILGQPASASLPLPTAVSAIGFPENSRRATATAIEAQLSITPTPVATRSIPVVPATPALLPTPTTSPTSAPLITVAPNPNSAYGPAIPLPASSVKPLINSTPGAGRGGSVMLPDGRFRLDLPDFDLNIIYEPNSFGASNLGEFIANWQEALDYVRNRLKYKGSLPMTFELRTDGAPAPLGLGVRGFSEVKKSQVYQLYDGSGDRFDRQYITAHELGHLVIFQKDGYGANIMLVEGFAMYASNEFLRRADLVTLHDFAVAAYRQKRLIPITTLNGMNDESFNGRLTFRANYDLSGSFVSWLIEIYGLEKFEKVYSTAQFQTVYGKSLATLNQEWSNFLADRSQHQPISFDSAKYFSYFDRVAQGYLRLYSNAALNGDRLDQTAYAALDTARLAADRFNYTKAEEYLQVVEKRLGSG